jgi:hypothetical protein
VRCLIAYMHVNEPYATQDACSMQNENAGSFQSDVFTAGGTHYEKD